MLALLITSVIVLTAALLLTPVVRLIAWRWGVLDCPDGKRKLHRRPVPLWGGVAVYLALVLGLLVARFGSFGTGKALDRLAMLVIIVGGLICLIGAIDDRYRLRARTKLLLQVLAVLPVVGLGCYVDRIAVLGYPVELGGLGSLLTIFWLIGCINALNLLDGMDGLASTVGLLTAAMMGIIAFGMGHPHVTVTAIMLAAALAGFLPYNLPRASIFLGDSGSMIIGVVVGVLGIEASLKTSATLSITTPVAVMTLPMLDSVLAVVRRKLTGQRLDAADRQHIHHRLLDRGLTPWQALCVIGSFCLMTGAGATASMVFSNEMLAWITSLTLVVLMVRLRLFGHHELALVKGAVAARLLAWANHLGNFDSEHHLPAAGHLAQLPVEDLWAMLLQEVKPWRVSRLEMSLTSPGNHPLQFDWTAAKHDEQAVGWSLSMCFAGSDGRLCQLQAGGERLPGIAFAGLAGLGRVLEGFGVHLAERPLSLLPPSKTREVIPTSLPDGQGWSKAA